MNSRSSSTSLKSHTDSADTCECQFCGECIVSLSSDQANASLTPENGLTNKLTTKLFFRMVKMWARKVNWQSLDKIVESYCNKISINQFYLLKGNDWHTVVSLLLIYRNLNHVSQMSVLMNHSANSIWLANLASSFIKYKLCSLYAITTIVVAVFCFWFSVAVTSWLWCTSSQSFCDRLTKV